MPTDSPGVFQFPSVICNFCDVECEIILIKGCPPQMGCCGTGFMESFSCTCFLFAREFMDPMHTGAIFMLVSLLRISLPNVVYVSEPHLPRVIVFSPMY